MTRPARSRPSPGLSLVELLVGLAAGLTVVSIALLAWAQQVRETRQLLLETQLMQALRTTTDLMTRNLRRAGHWAAATDGVWQGESSLLKANPHSLTAVTPQEVNFSRTPPGTAEPEPVDQGRLGYRLRQGVVEMRIGLGTWQAMTDPGRLVVTEMTLGSEVLGEPLSRLCAQACPVDAGSSCPPRQDVKRIALTLRAASARDPSVTRELRSAVRLRNDTLSGSCAG